jgi:hypothetical protein
MDPQLVLAVVSRELDACLRFGEHAQHAVQRLPVFLVFRDRLRSGPILQRIRQHVAVDGTPQHGEAERCERPVSSAHDVRSSHTADSHTVVSSCKDVRWRLFARSFADHRRHRLGAVLLAQTGVFLPQREAVVERTTKHRKGIHVIDACPLDGDPHLGHTDSHGHRSRLLPDLSQEPEDSQAVTASRRRHADTTGETLSAAASFTAETTSATGNAGRRG